MATSPVQPAAPRSTLTPVGNGLRAPLWLLRLHKHRGLIVPFSFIALLIVVVWAFSGPIFKFSDTWQLVINTGTTIVTFLMVFLIQNSQNRDARAIHLKLDALIHAIEEADEEMIEAEELCDEDLKRLHEKYKTLAEKTAKNLQTRTKSTLDEAN